MSEAILRDPKFLRMILADLVTFRGSLKDSESVEVPVSLLRNAEKLLRALQWRAR